MTNAIHQMLQIFLDHALAHQDRVVSQFMCARHHLIIADFESLQSYLDIWYGPQTSIFAYLTYYSIYLDEIYPI